jgi:hypothetical protein
VNGVVNQWAILVRQQFLFQQKGLAEGARTQTTLSSGSNKKDLWVGNKEVNQREELVTGMATGATGTP